MKYLNKFNESKGFKKLELEELKDFCQDSLAYLLDDKLTIDYRYLRDDIRNNKSLYKIEIREPHHKESNIKWDDIKDHFIPFLKRLSSKYNLVNWGSDNDYVRFNYSMGKSFSVYDVVNDNLDVDIFWSILLKVEI